MENFFVARRPNGGRAGMASRKARIAVDARQ
jgi:hypothetical protein